LPGELGLIVIVRREQLQCREAHHRRINIEGLDSSKLFDDNRDYQTIKERLPARRGWSLG